MESCGPFLADAYPARDSHGIDVCSEEYEFPAVSLLLSSDHALNFSVIVDHAGVLHPVCGDHEYRLIRSVLFSCILVDISYVADGPADGIEQRRAPSDEVCIFVEFIHPAYRDPVVHDLGYMIEQHGGPYDISLFLLLLFEHRVEASYRVGLEPSHRTAAVHDEHYFDFFTFFFIVFFILAHFFPPLFTVRGFIFRVHISTDKKRNGRPPCDKSGTQKKRRSAPFNICIYICHSIPAKISAASARITSVALPSAGVGSLFIMMRSLPVK